MMKKNEVLLTAINEAQLLGIFKTFCEKNQNIEEIQKLRNILALSNNKFNTITEIIKRTQNVLLNQYEAERFLELVTAFFKKSNFRNRISKETKEKLLIHQNCKCGICKCTLQNTIHVDHIIPFKYVGDELENNLQLLCPTCNTKKNASIDYQIRYLLKLI